MKNRIFIAFLFVFIAFTSSINAQEMLASVTQINQTTTNEPNRVSKNSYQQEAIYLKMSFWGSRYVKNGVSYKFGFKGKNLAKEFENYPAAQAEYKKYRKQLNTGKIVGVAALTASVVALLHYANRAEKTTTEIPPSGGEVGVYLGGIAIGSVIGTIGSITSYNTLQNAIFLRNQAICQ